MGGSPHYRGRDAKTLEREVNPHLRRRDARTLEREVAANMTPVGRVGPRVADLGPDLIDVHLWVLSALTPCLFGAPGFFDGLAIGDGTPVRRRAGVLRCARV